MTAAEDEEIGGGDEEVWLFSDWLNCSKDRCNLIEQGFHVQEPGFQLLDISGKR
jgi:hypothetical protein